MARRKKLTGSKSFHIDVDTNGISQAIRALEEGVQEAVRPVAYAGARVIYERVLMNVAGIPVLTGNFSRSIYHAFSPEKSKDGVSAFYHVSWNHKVAPHGRLVEWGYVKRYQSYIDQRGEWVTDKKRPRKGGPLHVPGHAPIRRAQSAFPDAVEAMKDELAKRLAALSYYGA